MSKLNIDISTPKIISVFLTPCLGDATISFGFRKNFPPTEWLLNVEIKLKYKRYIGLFCSPVIYRQEDAS